MPSLNSECKEQELSLLLLFFRCSRTLLRSNTPPLKQMEKMNAEEIALSEQMNSCSVTRHLGSSLAPEQSQRQHVHSQSLSILLTPGKVPCALIPSASPDFIPWLCWSPVSSSAQPCWRKSSQLQLPTGFSHLPMRSQAEFQLPSCHSTAEKPDTSLYPKFLKWPVTSLAIPYFYLSLSKSRFPHT